MSFCSRYLRFSILALAGIFFTWVVSLFLIKSALAVTLTLTQFPSTISDGEFTVAVQIDGPEPGTNYLRIDLFKENTSNYFGETFNGSVWYGGADGVQYLPVEISAEGSASATIRGRVGEPNTTKYPGPGTYLLKVRRYTSSGNAANDTQDNKTVEITVVRASPSPTPQPTPSPTPEATPKPTLSPTPSPVVKVSSSPRRSSLSSTPAVDLDVLGENTQAPEIAVSPSITTASVSGTRRRAPWGIFFVLLGIIFSGAAGFFVYRQKEGQKLV